jgi:hypothetical protein
MAAKQLELLRAAGPARRAGLALRLSSSLIHEIATPTENPDFGDLVGKSWQEVPTETVFFLRWDLEAFTRRGFRYYLPAFLSLAPAEPDVAETLTTYLMRSFGHRDALTPSEKDAVRAVLRHLRDRGDAGAAEALDAYWESFPLSPRDVERERLGHER